MKAAPPPCCFFGDIILYLNIIGLLGWKEDLVFFSALLPIIF
jgi:hypothetical protein